MYDSSLLNAVRITILLICCVPLLCRAAPFYEEVDKGKYGFYNYEIPPPDKEVDPEEDHPPSAPPEKKEVAWPSFDEAMKLPPKELGGMITKSLDAAIQNPTEETTLRWIMYTNAAREKSYAFSQAVSFTAKQNPEYGYFGRATHPTADQFVGKARINEERYYIDAYRDACAIIIFIDPDAPINTMVFRVAEDLSKDIGWRYEVVNAKRNVTLAKKLNVTMLPQWFLIFKDQTIRPIIIATGFSSTNEIKSNIHLGIKVATGETDVQNYNSQPGVAEPFTQDVFSVKDK